MTKVASTGGLNFGTGGGIDFGGSANPNGGNVQRNKLGGGETEGGCACRAGRDKPNGWAALAFGLIGALLARRCFASQVECTPGASRFPACEKVPPT